MNNASEPEEYPRRREKESVATKRATCTGSVPAGENLAFVKGWLGHANILNTTVYARLTTSLRQEVFAKLERHPKIVRVA